MRSIRVMILVLAVCSASVVLTGQTPRLTPPSGSSLPASCNIGDLFTKTSATAGLYVCTASNTWSILPGSGGGSGTVTNTAGALTANQLVIGNGGNDAKTLGSLGTATTVYHGNAAGAGSFGSVVESDQSLSDITTANVTSSAHGYAPKAPNDATKYLDGTGSYSIPAGGISGTANGLVTVIRKPSDQSMSNNTLANDNDFKLTVGASDQWEIEFVIFATNAVSTADIQFAATIPSGATMSWILFGYDQSATTSTSFRGTSSLGNVASGRIMGVLASSVQASSPVWIKSYYRGGGTGGTVQLQWSQGTTDGSNPTTIKADSYMKATKVQ